MWNTTEKAPRTCSVCKEWMWEGFCLWWWESYYCTEKCLNTEMTMKEWKDMYTDGWDNYWTQWEEGDIDDE